MSNYVNSTSSITSSFVVFRQCLPNLKALDATGFQFHPEVNNVIGILSADLKRFILLELTLDDRGIDVPSIEDPAYSVDLSKVHSGLKQASTSRFISFSFTQNTGIHDAGIFSCYLLTSNGTLFTVGPFIYHTAMYSSKLINSLSSIARQIENNEDYSEVSREVAEGFVSPFLAYLRPATVDNKSVYYLAADDAEYLRQRQHCEASK